MLMIGKTELAKRLYQAWRDGTPVSEDFPPDWSKLTNSQRARWRYVAEQLGDTLSAAMGGTAPSGTTSYGS